MNTRLAPTLARDDPDHEPLVGNIKVTREDWINIARDVLVYDGVGELKILSLSEKLGVSRSSFYWYFKNRKDLLNALLKEWETRNTERVIAQCKAPSSSISEAVSNFFRCFIDEDGFDPGLDFAVREWARRDEAVRKRIDAADQTRLSAVTQLFLDYGFTPYDADARARIVYFMQIGYHTLELRESIDTRLDRVVGFLRGFTGEEPSQKVVEDFAVFARSHTRTKD